MYCPNCGNNISEEASFCGSCGAHINNTIQPMQHYQDQKPFTAEDMRNLYEAATAQRRLEEEIKNTREYASIAADEYRTLKKRFRNCTVAGFLVLFFMGNLILVNLFKYGDTFPDGTFIFPMILMLGLMFFIPFGCLPILNFARNQGFFIVFTAFFFVILSALILTFASFAGIPCFFSLRSKIKKAKSEMNTANEQLAALAA